MYSWVVGGEQLCLRRTDVGVSSDLYGALKHRVENHLLRRIRAVFHAETSNTTNRGRASEPPLPSSQSHDHKWDHPALLQPGAEVSSSQPYAMLRISS